MNSGDNTPRNFREAGEFHHSHVHVDNHYLPPHRIEDVTPFIVIGGRPNIAKPIAPQRFVAHTNLVTQHEVYNELLPFVGGSSILHPTLGIGGNREQ